ncbi:MAG: nucleotide exchange factor GrpE [Sphingobacteriaceae bacterium]
MLYRKIKAINKDNMTESTENLTNEEEAPINSENAENNAEVNTVSEEEILDPQVQIDALNDKYLRLYAEFDNYKRRTAKERIELFKTANADVIKSMLSVLDDFDRAKKSMEIAKDIEAVKEGIQLIHHKLKSTLQSQGLTEMESIVGKAFDTDLHEAITNVPAPSEDLKGKVMDEVEKGYLLNEKVIRYAKVVVGS